MNMKKIRPLAFAASMMLAFGSCVDLDYNELTTNDEDWVYDSPIYGVEKLVNDIYAQLMNGFENNYNGALLASATDEASFALINSGIHKFYNGGWSANDAIPDYWKNSYTAIHEANNFLEKLDKIDLTDYIYSVTEQTSYEELRARFELYAYEIRALRAYYYFELVRAYGDVPLVLSTLTLTEANNVERTPAQEVLKFIVDECDAIAEYLPVSYREEMSQHLGRTSRPFVMSLKARALLYAASPLFNPEDNAALWEAAAEANKYVIDHAQDWGIRMGTYEALWGNDSFTNSEIIFAVAKTADNSFERQNYPVGIEGGSSGNCPTQSLVDQYEYQSGDNAGRTFGEVHPDEINITAERPYEGLDPRFAMTVVKNGDFWPLNSNQQREIQCYTNGFNASPKINATPTGYYLRKYVDGHSDLTPNVNSSFRHAWIIMRLPEFYLNYAECIYRLTGNADAQGRYGMSANEAINVVRGRSDVQMPLFSGNPVDFLARYERERLAEFAFEDHRFWDVRRWKKGSEYFSAVSGAEINRLDNGNIVLRRKLLPRKWDEKYNLFPIPFSEIQKNGKLTQNPGW
ncbi:MAG: RagB/SusD family nutrient uptake outer membrane protein [Muribaculaceae bacterium]|nr:RagB/SusD family nutrient uptake outer membrane protein [Muribaculaceae bacterium]